MNLKAFTGLQNDDKLELREVVPQSTPSVSAEKLLKEAFDNRSDASGFSRRLLEANRNVAKAKGDNGLNAT